MLMHRFLKCVEKRQNEEAKSILQQLENRLDELIDISRWTLLHYSVYYRNAEITQHLIARGCNVNAQDRSKVTPLMFAVKTKNVDITEILLQNNADIYASDDEGKSILELAFYSRIHSSPPVPLKQDSHIILQMIFDKVNSDFAKSTLSRLSIFKANDLMKLAIVAFGNEDITRFVLQNGFPIDFSEPQRSYTALHCAIILAKFENAKILIEYGANIDALDKDKKTISRYYTWNFEDVDENSEVLKIILRLSASLSQVFTILHAFSSTSINNLLTYGKKKTVKTILLSGIDVNAYLREGASLLSTLIRNDNFEVLDVLNELNIKFDVNESTSEGITVLISAVISRCPEKVEFLLRNGANVNAISSYGDSALTCVAYNANIRRRIPKQESAVAKIIELLLQYGANNIQSFFSKKQDVPFCPATKVIVAHLAMLGALEQPSLTASTRSIIESKRQIKKYFDLCVNQLDEMKNFKVNGTTTLFTLLSEKEESLVAYARNQELISSWTSAMDNFSHLEAYYLKPLQKRLARLLDEAKLQDKVVLAIGALTGMCSDVYRAVTYKIISYLNRQDLLNLCEIGSIV